MTGVRFAAAARGPGALAARTGQTQLFIETPYRNLALSATSSTDIAQGNISFKPGGQPETVYRNPQQLFDTLFAIPFLSNLELL